MRICAFSEFLAKVLFLLCFLLVSLFLNVQKGYANEEGVSVDDALEESEEVLTGLENDSVEKVSTGDFSVTPVVANEKAKPRDIIKKELLVTNNTNQRIDLYITVENIDPTKGAQEFDSPSVSDLSISLANWLEITRGVIELSPGESRKIPYLIHVNLTAKPGSYFARVQFKKGSKRSEAEVGKEGTSLMLNVEVYDDAKERLQLGNFMSDTSVVFGSSVGFSFLLENVGNRLVEPRGSIRIFNRRGEEVGSVPLNASGEEINPENKRQLATAWNAIGRFGKYKAFLDLEYGENQLASVQDTLYFWVFPWKEIFASLLGVFVLAIVGTYIVHLRAIAQPTYARDNKKKVPQSSLGANYAPPSYGHAVQQSHRPTHLSVHSAEERQVTMPSKREAVRQSGSQVTLQPRNNTQIHGNVVQLPSRRR